MPLADLSRPAVSTTLKEDGGKQLLRAQIVGPADGRYDIRSCDSINLTVDIIAVSGAPPYTLLWTDALSSNMADLVTVAMASFAAADVAKLPLRVSMPAVLVVGRALP